MIKPAIVFVTAAMFAANGWGAENARAAKYESIGISGGAASGPMSKEKGEERATELKEEWIV